MKVKAKSVLVQPVAAELVLYDEESHRAHRLDGDVAAVFLLADGTRDLSEIAAEASIRLGAAVASGRVGDILRGLDASGLLTEDGASRLVLQADRSPSRRGVLEGAVTVAIPGIVTVIAPTVTQAASPNACGIVRPCDG